MLHWKHLVGTTSWTPCSCCCLQIQHIKIRVYNRPSLSVWYELRHPPPQLSASCVRCFRCSSQFELFRKTNLLIERFPHLTMLFFHHFFFLVPIQVSWERNINRQHSMLPHAFSFIIRVFHIVHGDDVLLWWNVKCLY